ncbi:MAG: 50S ribosomal protein L9 [Clostridia bacterium]|nr:50S ribosomal protein L9 [Clostridia bacterium]
MKVVLLQDVKGQGKKNDVINVSDGYARNFLIKNKLAVEATATMINSLNISKAADEHRKAVEKAEAVALAKKLEGTTVVVKIKVGETGKLFGSLNTQAVADALAAQGITVDRKKIVIDGVIKSVGTYTVVVKPYAEVSAKIKVQVEAL